MYMLLHKVEPGPVPKYRFFRLSARDTVCPNGCDVLRSSGARQEAQLPDYTPSRPPLSVPV